MFKRAASTLLVLLVFAGGFRLSAQSVSGGNGSLKSSTISIDAATGFTVENHGSYKLVTVTRPWPGAKQQFRYLLVQRGAPIPSGYKGATVIRTPIRSIVELSSTFLAETVELGEAHTITGVEHLSYVYSPEVRKGIESGRIQTVGEGQSLDIEQLIKMNPDVIMTSAFGGAGDVYPKLEEAGLPVVINGDWVEPTPLGRAEWIKFISLFYDKGSQAQAIFSRVAAEYQHLSSLAKSAPNRPTVFANAPWQGTWGMPGGRSYMARLFRDAGADYLWSNTSSAGTLFLDFEAVFNRAANADYWINPGVWTTLAQATASDPRFAQFKAFKEQRLYNSIARTTSDGGNDYWESGPANPQRVLADLIEIFHPSLLPGRKLYYYERLK